MYNLIFKMRKSRYNNKNLYNIRNIYSPISSSKN